MTAAILERFPELMPYEHDIDMRLERYRAKCE